MIFHMSGRWWGFHETGILAAGLSAINVNRATLNKRYRRYIQLHLCRIYSLFSILDLLYYPQITINIFIVQRITI